jgi:hypothetical protein
MKRSLALVSLAAITASALAGPARAVTVELELVPNTELGGQRGVARFTLGQDGEATRPFANARGELRVKLEGGKVFCDVNADGKIDVADGEGVPAPARGRVTGTPPVFKVAATIGGRNVEYPLTLLYAQQGLIVLGSGAHLEGTLGDSTIEVHDADVSGSFADTGRDRIHARDRRAPAAQMPFGPAGSELGGILAAGDELYDARVTGGGKSLELTPYEGERSTLTLTPKAPAVAALLMLSRTDGRFTCQATSVRTTTLPAGDYNVMRSVVALRPEGDERPAKELATALLGGPPIAPMLMGQGSAGGKPISIAPGANALSPGPPFRLEFTARAAPEKRKLEVTAADVVGSLGARYRADMYGGDAEGALTVNVRAGGRTKRLTKLEYG